MKSISQLKPQAIPRRKIFVGLVGSHPPSDWELCSTGSGGVLNFKPAALQSYFFRNNVEIVFDAFMLAAAIEYCDYSQARPKMGWSRDFHLNIPVHNVEHWQQSSVHTPLIRALRKLTGDIWTINFREREFEHDWPKQRHLEIRNPPTAVMAFSDGMDSLAVAELVSKEIKKELVRVRLGKKAKGPKERFIAVPYEIKSGKEKNESSGRSRGFKFSILSGSAAYLSGCKDIIVPESGQGSLGPALVPVSRAAIDYRNHPLFFNDMTCFLSRLFDHEVNFEIPRMWNTKGETLAEYVAQTGDKKKWRETRSCWRGSRQTYVDGKSRQCGICAACMLRRMSVHAAGLCESDETYLWSDLDAKEFELGSARDTALMHDLKAHREYAIAGMAHLRDMAELRSGGRDQNALRMHAGQLAKVMNSSIDDTLALQDKLLNKHHQEWENFLESLRPESFLRKWARGEVDNAA